MFSLLLNPRFFRPILTATLGVFCLLVLLASLTRVALVVEPLFYDPTAAMLAAECFLAYLLDEAVGMLGKHRISASLSLVMFLC